MGGGKVRSENEVGAKWGREGWGPEVGLEAGARDTRESKSKISLCVCRLAGWGGGWSSAN